MSSQVHTLCESKFACDKSGFRARQDTKATEIYVPFDESMGGASIDGKGKGNVRCIRNGINFQRCKDNTIDGDLVYSLTCQSVSLAWPIPFQLVNEPRFASLLLSCLDRSNCIHAEGHLCYSSPGAIGTGTTPPPPPCDLHGSQTVPEFSINHQTDEPESPGMIIKYLR